MSSIDQSWADMNFDDARIKCFAEGGRLMRITSSLDLLSLDLASSFDQDRFQGHLGSLKVIWSHLTSDQLPENPMKVIIPCKI